MSIKTFPLELKENVPNFLTSLRKNDNIYSYFPVKKGITKYGQKLEVGFSTYALKILFITGNWNNLNDNDTENWKNYINSFQVEKSNYPINSFIDKNYLNFFQENKLNFFGRDIVKGLLNRTLGRDYELTKKKITNSIRAETKQCISSLYQVGSKNNKNYDEFTNLDITRFLDSFDWKKPWSAGAQFSALCVFLRTQSLDENNYFLKRDELVRFINKKVNIQTGAYFIGETPAYNETINGAMKVLTGLDWIDEKIHDPKKLIDICLLENPKNDGCDLVDIVYVLYRCSLETDYKRKNIIKYLENIYDLLLSHYFSKEGGFSYFLNKSQTNYYGVKISNGENTPDIHGTLLLTWAVAMIDKIFNLDNSSLNIIKP